MDTQILTEYVLSFLILALFTVIIFVDTKINRLKIEVRNQRRSLDRLLAQHLEERKIVRRRTYAKVGGAK